MVRKDESYVSDVGSGDLDDLTDRDVRRDVTVGSDNPFLSKEKDDLM